MSRDEGRSRGKARLTPDELAARAGRARDLLRACCLCANRCGVDRLAGTRGICGAGAGPEVAAAVRHFGEEPPLVGRRGSGAIFFSRCPLACVYCQNHQISQEGVGRAWTIGDLARGMLRLEAEGAANIDLVSPTPHVPAILEALARARREGLRLPIVYNTSAYETPECLALLEGAVDIYLPDIKYGRDEPGWRLSRARAYVEAAQGAIRAMHAQVGGLFVGPDGIARRGLIVRHLVLPGDRAGTREALRFLASLAPRPRLSLMGQYVPRHRAREYPPLDRPLSREEYDEAIRIALEFGFEDAWIQEPAAREAGLPDFQREEPFRW